MYRNLLLGNSVRVQCVPFVRMGNHNSGKRLGNRGEIWKSCTFLACDRLYLIIELRSRSNLSGIASINLHSKSDSLACIDEELEINMHSLSLL